jgi:glycosyltransferase involved in cell wall biosynthesis
MTRVLFLAERTALVDGNVPSHGSGAHVLATLRQLETRFEVRGVFAERAEPQSFALRRARRLVPGRLRGLRQDLLFLQDDRRFLQRALAVAAEFRPDVIYDRNEYFALAGIRLARRLGIPLVLEVNGLLDRDMRTFYRSIGEPLGAYAERWKLRNADGVVTVSTGLGRLLGERGADPRRTAIVPNSVIDERIHPEPRTVRAADDLVVGWVGHVMAWHSLDVLVDAAPTVLAAAPRTRFLIVGGGGGLDGLKSRVRDLGVGDAFEFTGQVPFETVAATVATFDVGVIPAHFDYAFPVKLAEMGAAGVPVVAPRTQTFDEMLKPGLEYAPFEGGSPEDFARALGEVLGDTSRRAALGTALHAAVRERYSWSAVAATLADTVDAVVARRAGRR